MPHRPAYTALLRKSQGERVHMPSHGRKGILAQPFSKIIQTHDLPESILTKPPGGTVGKGFGSPYKTK